ncbi:MAG: UDP-N-acetylmuramate--L-alanine ligase [Candidatus Omnitrophota bacterium]
MKNSISGGTDKNYHFIGIGGIGMSGIAQLLLHCGIKVTGSDIKESKVIQGLKGQGARIFIGHSPLNIKGADFIVYSSAVKEDNPEIVEARRLGIPILKRAQALARLMEDKTVITVAGSHGKTTTTSLVSYLLLEAGFSPTIAIGGILRNIDTNACLGKGEFFVAEADESDGSFLYYRPKYSIITNIDREHLDYYKEFKNELSAFEEFLNKTQAGGCVFCCADDAHLNRMIKGYKNKRVLFGLKDSADIFPRNILLKGLTCEFDCFYKGKFIDRFHLALGGEHNISNALSVIALGLELGIDLRFIKNILKDYKGAKRRLEIRLDKDGLLVIDDYAHHPSEIKASLKAIKNLKRKRVIAVFQPHRYSRTKLLLEEFGRSFDLADCVIITDIYAAGEPVLEGVDGRAVFEEIKGRAPDKEVIFLPKEEIAARILEMVKPDDAVVMLGAGDIVRICDDLVERLKR